MAWIFRTVFHGIAFQTDGAIERLKLRREHGLELFAGGEGTVTTWYRLGLMIMSTKVDFRRCEYRLGPVPRFTTVIQGPLCTIVRRWGFRILQFILSIRPARLHVNVEFRFYASQPWFHKIGSMKAVQDFSAEALRDDEWVFSGQSFTDKLWMTSDGKVRTGDVEAAQQENLWGVGFFHRDSKDSFMACS